MLEFITLEFLATFAGLVAAVSILVQFTKSTIKESLGDYAVRLYSFVMSLVLTFIFAKTGTGIEGKVLTILNAVIITIVATGTYKTIADPKENKSQ